MEIPYKYHNKIGKLSSNLKIDAKWTSDNVELDIFLAKPFWIWDKEQHKTEFISKQGQREVYYIPFDKKTVDKIIKESMKSNQESIHYIVKFAPETI